MRARGWKYGRRKSAGRSIDPQCMTRSMSMLTRPRAFSSSDLPCSRSITFRLSLSDLAEASYSGGDGISIATTALIYRGGIASGGFIDAAWMSGVAKGGVESVRINLLSSRERQCLTLPRPSERLEPNERTALRLWLPLLTARCLIARFAMLQMPGEGASQGRFLSKLHDRRPDGGKVSRRDYI